MDGELGLGVARLTRRDLNVLISYAS
jgi:hypothetical protein